MNNVKISGAGTVGGGTYNEIKISGAGKVLDAIRANVIKVAGSVKVLGFAEVKEVSISGSANFEKGLSCDYMKTSGSVKVEGEIKAQKIEIYGSFQNDLEVESESILINGDCRLNEVNVGDITIKSKSLKINELHADTVELVYERNPLSIVFGKREPYIGIVECTNFKADAVECRRLCTKDAVIGAKCKIDYLEYSGVVDVHVDAIVKEMVKLA